MVKFYNKRGTAEQWIKEGKYDLTMNGLFDPNGMEIVGSYNNIPLAWDDNDYETGVFVARKRMEQLSMPVH